MSRSLVLCATALLSLGAACGDDADSSAPPAAAPPATDPSGSSGGASAPPSTPPTSNQMTPPSSTPQQPAADASVVDAGVVDAGVADADGTYFLEVNANGTGCPAGSWNAQLASDKRSFTITFSAYDAEVTPQTAVSVKDCQLALKLRSKKPVAYAVQTFAFDGHAQLGQGVNAKLMASYYFQGNPVDDVESRVDVNGPFDRPFSFRQNVGLPEQVWSECGLERDLNVATRVRLMNGDPRASGRVNISQGTSAPTLFMALAQRACP